MHDQGHDSFANGENGGQYQQHYQVPQNDDRKIFVGGISWETTEQEIKEFFAQYGDVESVNLKTDPATGRSRGFAFVVFASTEGVEAALNAGELVIGKKRVEAKRAKARTGKVFVGGLPPDVSDEDIKSHFGAYGTIVELETPFDKVRNQRKGFIFITFEHEASMKNLLQQPRQMIGGKEVEVKKATPRPDQQMMGGMRGGMRGVMPMGGMGMGMARGRGMPPGRGAPAGGRGGWGGGWGQPQQQQQQQQWGGYGGGGATGGGYDAYGGGGYGYGAAASYGYGGGYGGGDGSYGGGYGGAPQASAAGGFGGVAPAAAAAAAAGVPAAGHARGGGQAGGGSQNRYQPY